MKQQVHPVGLGVLGLVGLLVTASLGAQAGSMSAPKRYLDEALRIMETYSLRRDSVDWSTIRRDAHARASGAHTTEDTYPAIRAALRALGDRHSFLQDPPPAFDPPALP